MNRHEHASRATDGGAAVGRRGADRGLAACGGDSLEKDEGRLGQGGAGGKGSIVVGSAGFTESEGARRALCRGPARRRIRRLGQDGEEPRAVRARAGEGRRSTSSRNTRRRSPNSSTPRRTARRRRPVASSDVDDHGGRAGEARRTAAAEGASGRQGRRPERLRGVRKEFAEGAQAQDPFRSRQVGREGQDRGGRRVRDAAVLRAGTEEDVRHRRHRNRPQGRRHHAVQAGRQGRHGPAGADHHHRRDARRPTAWCSWRTTRSCRTRTTSFRL